MPKLEPGDSGGTFLQILQASVRFHREGPEPEYFGIGLYKLAQMHIQSMKKFTNEIFYFSVEPANHLLSNRESNEAYTLAVPGNQYAVYFPAGGTVDIEIEPAGIEFHYRWISLNEGEWGDKGTLTASDHTKISTPDSGHWMIVIKQEL